MKKLLCTMLVLIGTGTAYALPLGNPAEPGFLCDGLLFEGCCYDFCQPGVSWCDAFSLRVGYYGDFVFNRHLEVDDNEFDADIEHTKLFTNAGYLAFNFWNRFDIFVTLGATNLYIDTNVSAFNGSPVGFRFEIETETKFSWSVGFRAILWEWCCFTLGMEAQYFHTRPDIRRITFAEMESIYPDHILDMKYREWQVGFGISRRIWNLVPYIGIKFSKAKADFDNGIFTIEETTVPPALLHDLKSKHYFGYVIGVSLIDCEKAAVTVEARFPDEKALYVNGQIRF